MADLNEHEKKLIKSIRELGLRPKADSAEELKEWLKDYHDGEEDEELSDSEDSKTFRLSTNTPKLSTFYGDVEKLSKGEVVYDQWQYEVQSLIEENYKEKQIQHAIRRSLKGSAAKVLKRMPLGSSVIDILKKFESVYGSADSRATVLRNFYSAEQEPGESVRDWSCRLEELLDKAISNGLVHRRESIDAMLCDKFWSGLQPELRNITGHKYDNITDFDELRTEIKKIEYEHQRKDKKTEPVTSKSAVTKKDESTKAELEELRGMIKQVASSVQSIEQEMQTLSCTVNRQQPSESYSRRHQSTRHSDFNRKPQRQDYNQRSSQQHSKFNRGQQQSNPTSSRDPGRDAVRQAPNYWKGAQHQRETTHSSFNYQDRSDQGATGTTYQSYRDEQYNQGPICYRCGQRGHIQRYCRVRTDHLHNLN